MQTTPCAQESLAPVVSPAAGAQTLSLHVRTWLCHARPMKIEKIFPNPTPQIISITAEHRNACQLPLLPTVPISSQSLEYPFLGFLCSSLGLSHMKTAAFCLTLESSSMMFCCSITCSLRKSTSLSSWLWSRSFKELGLLIAPLLCL